MLEYHRHPLLGETADVASVRNARWLAQQCRELNEQVIPMAADVAQALADAAGMHVDTGGMSSGALAELIDHLADQVEKETAKP